MPMFGIFWGLNFFLNKLEKGTTSIALAIYILSAIDEWLLGSDELQKLQ